MKKINSYILKDDIIKKMKEMIRETKKDELERQFDFCKSGNVLHYRNECIGSTCEVSSRRICDIGEFVGNYHTHPQPFSEQPSGGDLLNILGDGMGCIGSAKNNRAKCYFFDKDKSYDYIKGAYEKMIEIGIIEDMIIGKSRYKSELWPTVARRLDNLKEKNDAINKYFRIVRVI